MTMRTMAKIEFSGDLSTIEILNKLIQLDIDAVHSYIQAVDEIKGSSYQDELYSYLQDHQAHIKALSRIVIDLGGEPPSFSVDFKGMITSGYTAVKASMGIKQALSAMETNETITNEYYEEAMSLDMPEEIKKVVSKNYDDEKRHLAGVRRMIEESTNNS